MAIAIRTAMNKQQCKRTQWRNAKKNNNNNNGNRQPSRGADTKKRCRRQQQRSSSCTTATPSLKQYIIDVFLSKMHKNTYNYVRFCCFMTQHCSKGWSHPSYCDFITWHESTKRWALSPLCNMLWLLRHGRRLEHVPLDLEWQRKWILQRVSQIILQFKLPLADILHTYPLQPDLWLVSWYPEERPTA